MRFLVTTLAVMLSALSSYALSKSDSWSEILSNRDVNYSTVYGAQIQRLGLDNICLTASEIKSIRPIETCAAYGSEFFPDSEGGGHTIMTCKQTKHEKVTMSRTVEQQKCSKYIEVNENEFPTYECVSHVTTRTLLPAEIDVTVWEEHDEMSTWPGFTKKFFIPTCADANNL